MSNNIRDFRNAGAAGNSVGEEKSNTGFMALVIAIPVIAVAAGLGYKPLMEMRGKNVAAIQQAEADLDAKRRAENPLYALMNAPKNEDGLIDLNKPLNLGNKPSPEVAAAKKAVSDYAKRPLNAREFLSRVDAKAAGFSPAEMEMLKYTRANWALSTCRHSDLRKFYQKKNERAYNVLKAKQDEARDAQRDAMQADYKKLEIPKIENKTQALAFVASGGVKRHQEAAFGAMSNMTNLLGDVSHSKIRQRRQRFNKTGCMQVRTIIQSGTMTVKTNVRLK